MQPQPRNRKKVPAVLTNPPRSERGLDDEEDLDVFASPTKRQRIDVDDTPDDRIAILSRLFPTMSAEQILSLANVAVPSETPAITRSGVLTRQQDAIAKGAEAARQAAEARQVRLDMLRAQVPTAQASADQALTRVIPGFGIATTSLPQQPLLPVVPATPRTKAAPKTARTTRQQATKKEAKTKELMAQVEDIFIIRGPQICIRGLRAMMTAYLDAAKTGTIAEKELMVVPIPETLRGQSTSVNCLTCNIGNDSCHFAPRCMLGDALDLVKLLRSALVFDMVDNLPSAELHAEVVAACHLLIKAFISADDAVRRYHSLAGSKKDSSKNKKKDEEKEKTPQSQRLAEITQEDDAMSETANLDGDVDENLMSSAQKQEHRIRSRHRFDKMCEGRLEALKTRLTIFSDDGNNPQPDTMEWHDYELLRLQMGDPGSHVWSTHRDRFVTVMGQLAARWSAEGGAKIVGVAGNPTGSSIYSAPIVGAFGGYMEDRVRFPRI